MSYAAAKSLEARQQLAPTPTAARNDGAVLRPAMAPPDTTDAMPENTWPAIHRLSPATSELPTNSDAATRSAQPLDTEGPATSANMAVDPPVVLTLPRVPISSPPYTFEALEQWEGTVLSVSDGKVAVRLRDAVDDSTPVRDAELDLEGDLIEPSDRPLVQPGAIFYWTSGYMRLGHGQIRLTTTIRLRRLPAWTPREVKRAQRLASRYDALFDDL